MRPYLYVARRTSYLKEGYKDRKRRTVEGRARSGEVSPKGLVAHTEDWEGRIAAEVAPNALHLIRDPDGTVRKMTFQEMVDHGRFIVGRGPKGVREL